MQTLIQGACNTKFTIKVKGWEFTVLPLSVPNLLGWWEAGRTQGTGRWSTTSPLSLFVLIKGSNITECTDPSSACERVLNSAWHWYGPIWCIRTGMGPCALQRHGWLEKSQEDTSEYGRRSRTPACKDLEQWTKERWELWYQTQFRYQWEPKRTVDRHCQELACMQVKQDGGKKSKEQEALKIPQI